MYQGRVIFAQLMDFVPSFHFQRCVERYQGNKWVQTFSCWNQFLCMVFAQLTFRHSLRDIEACLGSQPTKLYHMGFHGQVSKSTLADANNNRDYRIYQDFAYCLIDIARPLYADESFGLDLDQTTYAFDSSTIDLCLSLFPWAKFRRTKGAVKIHTLLDLHGSIPVFIEITAGSVHDVNILDHLVIEPGSFIVIDRGYLDFKRLYILSQDAVYFVIRAKKNFKFRRVYSHEVDWANGIILDQTIALTGKKSARNYSQHIRRVRYGDFETGKRYEFLTNNFRIPATTVSDLYRNRWQIELFFKWIKQHLRIKVFYGTSENAVKTQIWIAVATYVLVAIVKKRLNLDLSLYTILQILSVNQFEKVPLLQLLTKSDYKLITNVNPNQLSLLD
jgi:IS4 transposase